MTGKKLQYNGRVGEKIEAIADPNSSIRDLVRYLMSEASTEEQREAVVALDEARDRQAACLCIPRLQRAFMLKFGLDGWPQRFGS